LTWAAAAVFPVDFKIAPEYTNFPSSAAAAGRTSTRARIRVAITERQEQLILHFTDEQ